MYIINFPRWLTALYTTVVKPFLNARTRSKIEILEKVSRVQSAGSKV
jgi:hypothetical protein